KNSFRYWEGRGLLRRLGYVAGDRMKGTYWTFGGTPLEAFAAGVDEGETVDVRPKTKEVFLAAEAAEFRFAEACVGVRSRGRYLDAGSWSAAVAREGASQDRHVSVGSFRAKEARLGPDEDTPCAVPY